MIALTLGLVAALVARRRGLVLVLIVGLTLNVVSLFSATGSTDGGSTNPAPDGPITLLIANVHVGLSDTRALEALIAASDPDLIGIIELSPTLAARLSARLDEHYPYRLALPREDPFGMGIWSRLPATRISEFALTPRATPSLVLNGESVGELWLVHPFPPISTHAANARDSLLAALAENVGARPDAIVAGDLNASPWSSAYRNLRRRTGLLDASAGNLPWPTWFGAGGISSVLAVPIDHVLHGRTWKVVSHRVGPDIGSDHRPLLVSLARTRAGVGTRQRD